MFFEKDTLNSFIPDSINPDELRQLMDEKAAENYPGISADEKAVCEVAMKHLDAMLDEIKDPIVHKVAGLMILQRFIDWHMTVAQNHLGETDSLAWAEDVGKLKSAYSIFRVVDCGDTDFTSDDKW